MATHIPTSCLSFWGEVWFARTCRPHEAIGDLLHYVRGASTSEKIFRITGFSDLFSSRILETRKHVGNWICFRPKRFLVYRKPNDGRSRKPSNPEYYSPSIEPFGIHQWETLLTDLMLKPFNYSITDRAWARVSKLRPAGWIGLDRAFYSTSEDVSKICV